MEPKNHRYVQFVEFGDPMNSVVRPQKKPNALKHALSAIQCGPLIEKARLV